MIEVELRRNKENKFVVAILGFYGDVDNEDLHKAVFYVGVGDRFPRMQAEALAFDDEEEAAKKGTEVYTNILEGRAAAQARKAWRRHIAP